MPADSINLGLSERTELHCTRVTPQEVLVVDDQRQSRMLLETMLHEMGHRPTGCQTAERALVRLRRHSFAIVLVDLHMPGMDGIELLQTIRAMEDVPGGSKPDLPIVLVTGDASVQAKVRATHSGATLCLIKPVGMEQLCELFESLLCSPAA